MSDYWFVKSVNLIRQTTWLATLVGQLYEDKSLALRARDLIIFTTDSKQLITQQFTARADLFLK